MIGKLLSTVIKIATLPIDVAEIGMDVMTGDDGVRRDKSDLPCLSNPRDAVCKYLEKEL